MKTVDQCICQSVTEPNVYYRHVGGALMRKPLSVIYGCGSPDDDHSYFSKERFQRLRYMPAVFDDEHPQPAQTRGGGAKGFLQHFRIPIRHGTAVGDVVT